MENAESLANIVFTRTAKGVNACTAKNDELPRQLKRLLLVLDGHSPVSKFIPYLTNLLPLSEKFADLESLGFIQKNHIERYRTHGQDQAISFLSSIEELPSDAVDTDQAMLAQVLAEIENFLKSSVGLQDWPITSELKKIRSIDHLKEKLPAYFDLIDSYDADAGVHVLKLEKLMLS